MIRSNGSTVMELPDRTSGIPLVLARSVKIRPGGNLEVPLECKRIKWTSELMLGSITEIQIYMYHLVVLTTPITNITPGLCR